MTATQTDEQHQVAPGSVVVVRDEEWLVTRDRADRRRPAASTSRASASWSATPPRRFYARLDDDHAARPGRRPRSSPTTAPRYRTRPAVAGGDAPQDRRAARRPALTVSTQGSPTPLSYQQSAVRKALDPANLRPRILLADAVGLGKTLEIGMILSELVRRGRGERILVVTPRHVLEQMQHELWTRFALPFVRLDSAGIQRVRQKLPATRNPFTYYKRVDHLDRHAQDRPLPSPPAQAALGRRRHRRVAQPHQRRDAEQPARAAARPHHRGADPRLATPHNGKAESFAELIRLLDPTAVPPGRRPGRGRGRAARHPPAPPQPRGGERRRRRLGRAAGAATTSSCRRTPAEDAVARRARATSGCSPAGRQSRTPAKNARSSRGRWPRRSCPRRRAARDRSRAQRLESARTTDDRAARERDALDRLAALAERDARRAVGEVRRRWSSTSSEIGVGTGLADAGRRLRRAASPPCTGCTSSLPTDLGLPADAGRGACTAG